MDDKTKSENLKPTFDPETFSANISKAMEAGSKVLATYMKPETAQNNANQTSQEMSDVFRTLNKVAEYWMSDPNRAMEVQTKLGKAYLELWGSAARRMTGEDTQAVASPEPSDKRFKDPEWSKNQFFDFIKQAYLLTSRWANDLVTDADNLDEHTRHKAQFYVQQIANALAPSNFLFTNPEVIRETIQSKGENLAKGFTMLAEDIEAGGGQLRVRQTDMSKFQVGRDLAVTPGKVVYQNELMQLIQYSPTTEKVLRTPLLIVPPWINKFYILDLTPEKSYIKWCVEQGLTVFVISWVNPDERHAHFGFDDYMKLGPLTALDIVEKITGEMKVHTIGYCVGGTMLSVTLAYLAALRQVRVTSATLFTAQVDFTYAGDLLVFSDEDQIASLEKEMQAFGYLDAKKMSGAFNMLRSNDLLWPYVINNYLKGKAPMPFDLLYWNADSTRMTAANHSYYLRNCYLDNNLSKGEMAIDGIKLDLHKVKTPIYMLSTREDHIAPARSGFFGKQFFGGPVRFVLAGSGHIAGVVNPPVSGKYQYWLNDNSTTDNYDEWVRTSTEHKGSWWPNWIEWIRSLDPEEIPARQVGSPEFPAIEDAPGSYVKMKA